MNSFYKLFWTVIISMVCITVIINLIFINYKKGDEGRPYRVEAERIAYALERGEEADLSGYSYIKQVEKLDDRSAEKEFYSSESEYLIMPINGELYRFDYITDNGEWKSEMLLTMNITLGVIFLFIIIIMLYIRNSIIAPFDSISNLPEELAKGNITVPLKTQKAGYFGKFIWGLDLLRERLEKDKQQDLETQKNNKSLILSLSHDIKTPLSIIELNSKALERGLYENDKEKKEHIAIVINEKCGEIKTYVDRIIQASKEEFLELEVHNTEFYLTELMDNIKSVYSDKMELLQIDFIVDDHGNCMLKGDPDRAVEVMQNLLENAVKYGNSKKIEISFSREENSQLITVINTGCTLADTELPHIFDSFWRGSNTGSNTGSGLGLYICRQLMNLMGGEIFAEIHDGNMYVTAVFEMA